MNRQDLPKTDKDISPIGMQFLTREICILIVKTNLLLAQCTSGLNLYSLANVYGLYSTETFIMKPYMRQHLTPKLESRLTCVGHFIAMFTVL